MAVEIWPHVAPDELKAAVDAAEVSVSRPIVPHQPVVG